MLWISLLLAAAAGAQELFKSTAEHAFVSTSTNQPATINGVNLKRPVYVDPNSNQWGTPYIVSEIQAMAAQGAPKFNAIRVTMDWPVFHSASKNADGSWTAPTFNTDAFAQLDSVVLAAKNAGLYVILDPIHYVTVTAGMCNEPAMKGARRSVPPWAWAKVGLDSGTACDNGSGRTYLDKSDDALALPECAAYLREVVRRYSPGTYPNDTAKRDLAKQVIAVDLVNEPHSSDEQGVTAGLAAGSAMAQMQTLVNKVYAPWLAATGPNSVRAANPDKILIVSPIAGSGALKGVNLSAVALPNVVMTFHDYFGSFTSSSDNGIGRGWGTGGYSNAKEDMDNASAAELYNPATVSFADRKVQHKQFLETFVGWSNAAGMPVFVGEYGIINACKANKANQQPWVTQYAQDTNAVYTELGLSRTYWTHGSWDDMALWWRGSGSCQGVATKNYLPHAIQVTGGQVR